MPNIAPFYCYPKLIGGPSARRLDSASISPSECRPVLMGGLLAVRSDNTRVSPFACNPKLVGGPVDQRLDASIAPSAVIAGLVFLAEHTIEYVPDDQPAAQLIFGVRTSCWIKPNNPFLTVSSVGLQVYALWGFQLRSVSEISIGLPAITAWLNTAMQMIYSRADRLNFFNRETLPLAVDVTGALALDSGIQKVLGPVRLAASKKTLRPLASESAFDQFNVRFLDDSSSPPAYPLAYWLESKMSVDNPDTVGLTLHLTPAPTAETEVLVDVVKEPVRYSEMDFRAFTPLKLPHRWAESILLPLVKKWAMGDTLMPASMRQAVEKEINEQYANAMTILGLADPAEPANQASQPKEAAQPES